MTRSMVEGLWGIVAPVIVAAGVLLSASWANRKFAPVSSDTLKILQTRVETLEGERNECKQQLAALMVEISGLRKQVSQLTSDNYAMLQEQKRHD